MVRTKPLLAAYLVVPVTVEWGTGDAQKGSKGFETTHDFVHNFSLDCSNLSSSMHIWELQCKLFCFQRNGYNNLVISFKIFFVWDSNFYLGVCISDKLDESFFWPTSFDHRDAFLQSEKFYQI